MRIELTHRWAQLMERGGALAAHKDPAVRDQFDEIRAFYEFLEIEQASILQRWEKLRLNRRPRARPQPTP